MDDHTLPVPLCMSNFRTALFCICYVLLDMENSPPINESEELVINWYVQYLIRIPLSLFIKIHTTLIVLGSLLQNLTLQDKDKYLKCPNKTTMDHQSYTQVNRKTHTKG